MTFQFRSEKQIVSALFLWRVYQSCQKLGARRPVLLKALELQESHLRDPSRSFHMQKISDLLRAAGTEIDFPGTPMGIACQMVPSGFSDPGYLATFEADLKTVVQRVSGAQRLGRDRPVFSLEQHEFSDCLIWKSEVCSRNDLVSLVFAVILESIGQLLQTRQPTVWKICFAHARPKDWRDWCPNEVGNIRLVHCFNQPQNRIEFHRGFFEKPNPNRNMAIVELAHAQRDRRQWHKTPFAKLCYDYLIYLLDKSGLNLDSATETMAMAERTLRRKLVVEGTSFRQILERVRRDVCQLYFLEGTRRLAEISTKLGYSELSAFTRAYTGWYGHPPSQDASGRAREAA